MEQLVLITPYRNPLFVDLYKKPSTLETWGEELKDIKSVFSDQEYSFKLENINIDKISKISVFINDEKEDVLYKEGVFVFSDGISKKRFVFSNRFGFADFSIVLQYEDNTIETFYSEYISILVHRDQDLETIGLMVDYVYNKQDQLLVNGEVGSKTKGDVKPAKYIDLDTKIALANEILKVYKDSYGYFSANSRFKTDIKDVVDDSNKLQIIKPKTLQYISTHPGYLRQGGINSGIRVGDNSYIPQKTLMEQKVYSFDIYENNIIVGFLNKMIDDINTMISDVNSLLTKRKSSYNVQQDYIHSSYFIFQRTERVLSDGCYRLTELEKEFAVIRSLYKRALRINAQTVHHMPKPSAIFMSVPQYNIIYNHIHEWFKYGIYNLEHEKFMMSFINGSSLYEVYVLAKIIDAMQSSGYPLIDQNRYVYKMSNNSFYNNTLCNNTFVFKGQTGRIFLYYQPVIYDSTSKVRNGIDLYRNNTYAFEGEGSYYYTPDFLIKYEKEDEQQYVILDAKYSDKAFIVDKQISALQFKYLFSITPRSEGTINGLYVLYGKAKKYNRYESVYNKQIEDNKIVPKYEMVPLSAGVNNDKHLSYLIRIIRDVIQ